MIGLSAQQAPSLFPQFHRFHQKNLKELSLRIILKIFMKKMTEDELKAIKNGSSEPDPNCQLLRDTFRVQIPRAH
jgi:hypothetical protein